MRNVFGSNGESADRRHSWIARSNRRKDRLAQEKWSREKHRSKIRRQIALCCNPRCLDMKNPLILKKTLKTKEYLKIQMGDTGFEPVTSTV